MLDPNTKFGKLSTEGGHTCSKTHATGAGIIREASMVWTTIFVMIIDTNSYQLPWVAYVQPTFTASQNVTLQLTVLVTPPDATFDSIRANIIPLSSRGLLARLMVVSPELRLWARAAASFWAKSLWSVRGWISLCVYDRWTLRVRRVKRLQQHKDPFLSWIQIGLKSYLLATGIKCVQLTSQKQL